MQNCKSNTTSAAVLLILSAPLASRAQTPVVDDAAVNRFYSALANQGVRVANGTWFGDEFRVFRLGFGLLPMQDLEAALTALSAALDQETQT